MRLAPMIVVAPFFLAAGDNIRFRAVDVNGNTEPTHVLTA